MQEILEKLSDLEHEQWMYWSKSLAKLYSSESITTQKNFKEKLQSWDKNWKPYSELPEDVKEHDRKWARKVLEIFIREAKKFEKDLIEHPLLNQDQKEKGTATIHDFIHHLELGQLPEIPLPPKEGSSLS